MEFAKGDAAALVEKLGAGKWFSENAENTCTDSEDDGSVAAARAARAASDVPDVSNDEAEFSKDRGESVGSVQEAAWAARRDNLHRAADSAVHDNAARCARARFVARPDVAGAALQIRPGKWPQRWPSRARRHVEPAGPPKHERAPVVAVENGRAAALVEHARRTIDGKQLDGTFYIVDLGAAEALYDAFKAALPRVTPHYAVKCFPNAKLCAALAARGAGFDCASAAEAELVVKTLGVSADRVIFANPCKRDPDLRAIHDLGINWATFDCADELHKMRARAPRCRALLRLRCDDKTARLPFGTKYGALAYEIRPLLDVARCLGVEVVGFAFHVGSGARSAHAYSDAISVAREAFDDLLASYGSASPPELVLDIGGGFAGGFGEDGAATLSTAGDESVAGVINAALEASFFSDARFEKIRVIAEPGRYFAEASAVLCTKVVGERHRFTAAGEDSDRVVTHQHEYWITDGVYGGFNAIIYDGWLPHAVVINMRPPQERCGGGDGLQRHRSTVFGPTCDSLDIVFSQVDDAPHLQGGDWLLFPCCGAYTLAGATDFNGVPATELGGVDVFYVRSKSFKCTPDDAALNVLYAAVPPMELVRNFNRHE